MNRLDQIKERLSNFHERNANGEQWTDADLQYLLDRLEKAEGVLERIRDMDPMDFLYAARDMREIARACLNSREGE